LPGSAAAAAPVTPWVTAQSGHFVDTSTGQPVVLRGVNVKVNNSTNTYKKAVTLGADFVRLSPSWEEIEPKAPVAGRRTYDQTFRGYLDAQVSYYASQNVNVLIDVHQSGWSSYFAPVTDGTARGLPPWLYTGKYTVDTPGLGKAKADLYSSTQVT